MHVRRVPMACPQRCQLSKVRSAHGRLRCRGIVSLSHALPKLSIQPAHQLTSTHFDHPIRTAGVAASSSSGMSFSFSAVATATSAIKASSIPVMLNCAPKLLATSVVTTCHAGALAGTYLISCSSSSTRQNTRAHAEHRSSVPEAILSSFSFRLCCSAFRTLGSFSSC